jgi:SAM-dependent methyltransferase
VTGARNPYIGAYRWRDGRASVWRAIAAHVARDAPGANDVLELGAGFCDFINAFPAKNRIAFDLNPGMRAHAHPGVDLRIADCRGLTGLATESFDLIFASNFLEHLSYADVEALLGRALVVLRPAGRLILIQPNFHRCPTHYFDDPTHQTVFHEENIPALLVAQGFHVVKLHPGLLPFSMNSWLPKSGLLTRLYLASPIKPLGAQMYVVAQKTRGVPSGKE